MNIKFKAFTKYLLSCAIIFVCSFASIIGVFPFSIGIYFSLCFIGLNAFILSPAFILGAILNSFSFYSLLGVLSVSVITCLLYLLRILKKIPSYIYFIAVPISICAYIPLMLSDTASLILFVFFVPITMYIASVFFKPIKKRGIKNRLLDNELICGGILLCIFALGLNALNIYYFPLVALVGSFLILLAGRVYSLNGALITGICFAIGSSIFDYQIIWLAYYPIMALLSAIFIPTKRIISATACLIGFVLITYFFEIPFSHIYLWLIAILSGGIIYSLIPYKFLLSLKNTLNPDYSPSLSRFNINLLRQNISDSVFKTGEVFEEMSYYIQNQKENTLLTKSLVGTVRENVCKGCGKNCLVSDSEIETLLSVSIEKGRPTIVDLPDSLTNECRMIPSIINASAKITEEITKKKEKQSGEALAKSIVSSQLLGVGDVLKQMSNKLKNPVLFEFSKENKIKEELNYRGIYCLDVLISNSLIMLTIDRESYERQEIEKVLKRVTKECYKIEREEECNLGVILYAVISPIYDVVFASASIAKGEISGDTHSFIKINSDKFLMALSDGMGCGEKAEKFSSSAISLIECFYKAGFDNATVIRSVNRFLSLSGEESFSALDLCVLNLNTAIADIFKIASPACYVKGEESVRVIEGSSLPIGVLEDIRPSFSEIALNNGDLLIFVSDGVADCFSLDELGATISVLKETTPKAITNRILDEAKKRSKKQRDDMTVTAFKIFLNDI